MPDHLSLDEVKSVLERYFEKGERTDDIAQSDMPELDADLSFISWLFEHPKVVDDDYLVFGHFHDPNTTILDIGANYGYSATSIWFAGSRSGVISFEPNFRYQPMLADIARRVNGRSRFWGKLLKRDQYAFVLAGASDQPGQLEFAMPVLNGKVLAALSTAQDRPHIGSMAQNILTVANGQNTPVESLKVFRFTAPVETIDTLLKQKFQVKTNRIVAVKLDVEGLEARVLAGARKLLARRRPLIMAESGHAHPEVVNLTRQHGYVLAERSGSSLTVSETPTKQVNGFFVHPDNFEYYRSIGLLN